MTKYIAFNLEHLNDYYVFFLSVLQEVLSSQGKFEPVFPRKLARPKSSDTLNTELDVEMSGQLEDCGAGGKKYFHDEVSREKVAENGEVEEETAFSSFSLSP